MATPPVRPIKLIAVARRISQRQVANALNLDHGTVWRIFNGYEEPTPKIARQLARYFKSTPEELFGVDAAVSR